MRNTYSRLNTIPKLVSCKACGNYVGTNLGTLTEDGIWNYLEVMGNNLGIIWNNKIFKVNIHHSEKGKR